MGELVKKEDRQGGKIEARREGRVVGRRGGGSRRRACQDELDTSRAGKKEKRLVVHNSNSSNNDNNNKCFTLRLNIYRKSSSKLCYIIKIIHVQIIE